MARYERDYGRDFGRWGYGPQYGGMRSDGWGGSGDWRRFAGEEGWYGEGYEGMPGNGFDEPFRGGEWENRGGRFGGGYGGGSFRGSGGGYGSDFRQQGGGFYGRGGRDEGYGGREQGYGGDYQSQRGFNRGSAGGAGSFWNRTRAAEIMTADPQSVTPDATLAEVAKKMRDLDVGIIPVVDDANSRRLRGVITDRDIAVRAVAEGRDGKARVSDCMTDSVRSVNKNDSVREVMRIMSEEQVRRVPVTDREGRLVGIIAQADLAVDYASDDGEREREVGSTVEEISRPGRPNSQGANRMAASSQTGGNRMGATSQSGGNRMAAGNRGTGQSGNQQEEQGKSQRGRGGQQNRTETGE